LDPAYSPARHGVSDEVQAIAPTYFEDLFAGYGQPGNSAQFFELFSEYEPPYGNALAWSQWFDGLAGPPLENMDWFHNKHEWHHVAVTLSNSNNIGTVLFLDGVPVATRGGTKLKRQEEARLSWAECKP
jgi:hypothetical protein